MALCPARSTAALAPLFVLLACAHAAPARVAADMGPGRWEAAPPLRHQRSAHAVVSTGAEVYVLGGSGAGRAPVLEVERFDGQAWHEETRLPGEGLNAPAAAQLGDCLYLVGGFSGVSNLPTDRVHCYAPATRTWREVAPLPSARGGHAAAVLDGRLHVVGGGNSRSTLADHSAYDPASNTWRDLAPLPRSKGSPALLVVDGRLWAIGGRSGPSDFGEVDVYDAATDTWSPGPALPPRGTHGAVVYRGAVHVFGGESQALGQSLASVLRLDHARGAWHEVAPLPTPRTYARAVLFGDTVLVVGGSPSAGRSHSAEGSAVVERYTAP